MATKLIFKSDKDGFKSEYIDYIFVPGFAPSQRKKCVQNLHESIISKYPNSKILEVSTKSDNPVGIALSAFNLKLHGKYVESIFQSSKVFNDGKQYIELLNKSPRENKAFIKSLPRIGIKAFVYEGKSYPLNPVNAFYDFIYINALLENKELLNKLKEYDIFTDIEFNDKKSLNCQAKTCALISYLLKTNQLNKDSLTIEEVIDLEREKSSSKQLNLFDFS